jgi:hypothetical protein
MGALDGKALTDRDALDGGDRGARGGEARVGRLWHVGVGRLV